MKRIPSFPSSTLTTTIRVRSHCQVYHRHRHHQRFHQRYQRHHQTFFCTGATSQTTKTKQHVNVAIVGGGAVGSLMAKLLAQQVPSLQIALLDVRSPKLGDDVLQKKINNTCTTGNVNDIKNKTITTTSTTSSATSIYPNARAYALSPTSLKYIGPNIIQRLKSHDQIAFYDSMQIWESNGPATLHFTKDDICNDDDSNDNTNDNTNNNVLGAVIEDEPLVSCLWDELREQYSNQVDCISPSLVQNIIPPTLSLLPSLQQQQQQQQQQQPGYCRPIEIQYQSLSKKDSNGDNSNNIQTITADLLIAADGSNSIIRKLVNTSTGAFPTISIGYGRKAITCTVLLDRPMNNIAFQRFQPNGPIALLPIWSNDHTNTDDKKKYYANIVWSTTPTEANEIQNMTNTQFLDKINELLQSGPTMTPSLFSKDASSSTSFFSNFVTGLEMLSNTVNTGLSMSSWTERQRGFVVPPVITDVVGKRFGFDLNLMHVKNYVGPRVCLIGDAAHTIHPMAGQGLNLGMADAASLTRHIKRSVQSGMGIQDNAGLKYALQQYESERQREVLSVMGGIQFLHEAFGTTLTPAIHLRSIGMNVINSLGPIRRKLVKVATGEDGVFHKK